MTVTVASVMRKADLEEARRVLASLLDAIGEDSLTANTPTERRLVRRLEGALFALDATLGDVQKRSD
jgi:hypothetical protein